MMRILVGLMCVALCGTGLVIAQEVQVLGHWDFEDGVDGEDVPDTDGFNTYRIGTVDLSGNGNHLCSYEDTETFAAAAYIFIAFTSEPFTPATGVANTLAAINAGDVPGMFTWSAESLAAGELIGTDIEPITPLAFTVECSIYADIDLGGYRTFLGRDGNGVADPSLPNKYTADPNDTQQFDIAPLYLQKDPDQNIMLTFTTMDGVTYRAIDYGEPDPADPNLTLDAIAIEQWYHVVGVSDGKVARLYVDTVGVSDGYELVGEEVLDPNGDNRLSIHHSFDENTDCHEPVLGCGAWSVGRGFFGGGHVDRWIGVVDDARITVGALTPSEFLYADYCSDINVDTYIDMIDYALGQAAAGNNGSDPADINEDGTVNAEDGLIIIKQVGMRCRL